MNLSAITEFRAGIAVTAAGTTTIAGTIFDMSGFEGILWGVVFGTAATDNSVQAQQGAAANMSDAADLIGTLVTVGASDEFVWLDLYRPLERYVRCEAVRGTSTTIVWGFAFQYGPRNKPTDNAVAGTLAGELHISPAEGTP